MTHELRAHYTAEEVTGRSVLSSETCPERPRFRPLQVFRNGTGCTVSFHSALFLTGPRAMPQEYSPTAGSTTSRYRW